MAYPIALDIKGRNVLVIGGGTVATRKVRGLLDASARVRVVAPDISDALAALRDSGDVSVSARRFQIEDVRDAELVFACTDDPTVNAEVVAAARHVGVFANSATGGGDFTLPARTRRGALQVGVWSGGSPALAVRARDVVEDVLDERWGEAADLFGRLRRIVAGRGTFEVRGKFWRRLSAGVPDAWQRGKLTAWIESVAQEVGLVLDADEVRRAVDDLRSD